tara:strand:+ start:51 stop:299 length:249 start_codon:yes stop_codon:yes gene_type:complete
MSDKKYTPGFLFNIIDKSKIDKILGYKFPDYFINKTPKKPMKKSGKLDMSAIEKYLGREIDKTPKKPRKKSGKSDKIGAKYR